MVRKLKEWLQAHWSIVAVCAAILVVFALTLLATKSPTDSVVATTPSQPYTSSQDVEAAQEQSMRDEALALLDPLYESFRAGAPPELALRELIGISCEQSLDNPRFWSHASDLYQLLIKDASGKGLLVRDWSPDLTKAVTDDCLS